MVTALERQREEFRQEAFFEEEDGVCYLVLHGENDNVRNSQFKKPFNPHEVNGLDDGDPHFV